jgi:hypothetical protein
MNTNIYTPLVMESSYGKESATTLPVTTTTGLINHLTTLPLHKYIARIRKKYKISKKTTHLISLG